MEALFLSTFMASCRFFRQNQWKGQLIGNWETWIFKKKELKKGERQQIANLLGQK